MIPGYGPDNAVDTAGFPGYAEIKIQTILLAAKYALDYDLGSFGKTCHQNGKH